MARIDHRAKTIAEVVGRPQVSETDLAAAVVSDLVADPASDRVTAARLVPIKNQPSASPIRLMCWLPPAEPLALHRSGLPAQTGGWAGLRGLILLEDPPALLSARAFSSRSASPRGWTVVGGVGESKLAF
jgi:hypothetical protein